MEKTIYTIGYAGFSQDEFILELHNHGITALIDVRSSPHSAFHTEYNREVLNLVLSKAGIKYRNYIKEFGARQEDTALYSTEGYLDFERFAQTAIFKSGISKVCAGINAGYVPTLMCAEKNPIDCHRAILVSRAFYELGYSVIHICPDSKTLTQADLEKSLLEKYYPNRDQFSLFDAPNEDELIKEAYRKRNAEIGYRIKDDEE